MLGLLLSFFGGPVINGLLQGYRDKLAADQTHEKLATDLAIKELEAQIDARANAKEVRLATAGYPEQRFLAFVAGLIPVTHFALIGFGTYIVAPLGWSWFDWTLHIPNMPAPWGSYEGPILLSFFGLVGVSSGIKAIAGAIARRK